MLYRANIGLVCISSTSNCLKGVSSSLQYLTVLTWVLLDVYIYFLCCIIRSILLLNHGCPVPLLPVPKWVWKSQSSSARMHKETFIQYSEQWRCLREACSGAQDLCVLFWSNSDLNSEWRFHTAVQPLCPTSVITKINSKYRICKFQHTIIWS